MVLAFKACAIQSRRPGASTPRDRYLHRNSAKQREQRTRSHVDTRTGIPEEVTAGVGLKGGVAVGAPGDKERNRAGGRGKDFGIEMHPCCVLGRRGEERGGGRVHSREAHPGGPVGGRLEG